MLQMTSSQLLIKYYCINIFPGFNKFVFQNRVLAIFTFLFLNNVLLFKKIDPQKPFFVLGGPKAQALPPLIGELEN